jgi:hypothetical protein
VCRLGILVSRTRFRASPISEEKAAIENLKGEAKDVGKTVIGGFGDAASGIEDSIEAEALGVIQVAEDALESEL